MLVSTATASLSIATASPALPHAAVVIEHTSLTVTSPAFLTENGVAAAPTPSSPAYVVHGATPSGASPRHLGDPFRWRELYELAIDDGVARVEPFGISFAPHVLNVDVAGAIDELLTETAIDDPVDELDQLPESPVAAPAGDAGSPTGAVRTSRSIPVA